MSKCLICGEKTTWSEPHYCDLPTPAASVAKVDEPPLTPGGCTNPACACHHIWKSDEVPMSMRMPSKPADAASGGEVGKWNYCPECGDTKATSGTAGMEASHRMCNKCGQEWFTDIDYAETVHANISTFAETIRSQSERIAEGDKLARVVDLELIERSALPDSTRVALAIALGEYHKEPPLYPRPQPSREPQGEVQIQRYFASPFATAEIGPSVTMDKAPDGDWVHYSDHARALASANAESARLRGALENIIRHNEIVVGGGLIEPTTSRIARAALHPNPSSTGGNAGGEA